MLERTVAPGMLLVAALLNMLGGRCVGENIVGE